MNLKTQLSALESQSNNLALAERAELSCRLAKQLEKAGDYEAAGEALREFWPDREMPLRLEGLNERIKADVLLRVGALAGWQGGAAQTEGCQSIAKDLITKSIGIFEKRGESERLAEALGELALCYWREGSYDEARIHLGEALSRLDNENSELKAILLIRAGIVEVDAQRFDQALRLYSEALPLVERTDDHALKGGFHVGYGLLLRRLATPENREDYMDRALIEYAAASFHFEQAKNTRALARVENNLGYLFFSIARYKDAHKHLDLARHLFRELKDIGTAAKVDETRARTLLAEGHLVEAERIVRSAVRTLQRGGEQAVLAEALTTHGTALARLGNDDRALALFQQAVEVAETAGDLEGAGRAKLSTIEEMGEKLSIKELISIYRSASELLQRSQDPSTGKRLAACATKLLDAFERMEPDQGMPEPNWEGFSMRQYLRTVEKAVIERALRDAGGSVTRASRVLGFKHHHSLASIINTRHKELLKARSTVRRRRRHLFSKTKEDKKKVQKRHLRPVSEQVSILHVEDNAMVAKLVGDILATKNWRVELCTNGDEGLRKLTGSDHYDVLVIDNNLPGLSGLELVRRARKITHRRRTPIVMLSGDDVEKEAWRAGANAFVSKAEAVDRLASTVTRLLREQDEPNDFFDYEI